jgi:hypothetical protein
MDDRGRGDPGQLGSTRTTWPIRRCRDTVHDTNGDRLAAPGTAGEAEGAGVVAGRGCDRRPRWALNSRTSCTSRADGPGRSLGQIKVRPRADQVGQLADGIGLRTPAGCRMRGPLQPVCPVVRQPAESAPSGSRRPPDLKVRWAPISAPRAGIAATRVWRRDHGHGSHDERTTAADRPRRAHRGAPEPVRAAAPRPRPPPGQRVIRCQRLPG